MPEFTGLFHCYTGGFVGEYQDDVGLAFTDLQELRAQVGGVWRKALVCHDLAAARRELFDEGSTAPTGPLQVGPENGCLFVSAG